MVGLYLVEPVLAIYAFSTFLTFPLVPQYIYRRLWQDLTNTTYSTDDDGSRCISNSSINHTNKHEEVQKAASLFSLYSELSSIIPSLIVTLLLVAYSDYRGRKITIILPVVGFLLYAVAFLAISFFELNIYLLIMASCISSMFGGYATMLGGCFSYVADRCDDKKTKTLRMAAVDMVLGLLSGVASLCTGYFLRAAGFNWPIFTAFLFQGVNLLYAVFVLEETVKLPDLMTVSGPLHISLQKLGSAIYQIFALASPRTKTLLVLMLLIFFTFSFSFVGSLSIVTLYELNEPLCWSEILIGYGSALSTFVFLTSFIGVFVFSRFLPNVAIVFIGLLSVVAGLIMTAFAKTTLVMFLARVPMLLSVMPAPVLRSMMSSIVSKTEQGALFACVACLESLSTNVAVAVFSSIYAATVAWFPGFCFLLGGLLCLFPISMLG
ncbi:solute carrier family 46 member 3-like [Scleropages formosus]|nr:solute carrier family 46 member 3-like [Scleropages formosus]